MLEIGPTVSASLVSHYDRARAAGARGLVFDSRQKTNFRRFFFEVAEEIRRALPAQCSKPERRSGKFGIGNRGGRGYAATFSGSSSFKPVSGALCGSKLPIFGSFFLSFCGLYKLATVLVSVISAEFW